ncbi:hypothetical protein HPB49_013969 [Dermacentor silvarum]|uniref:Uncharacterized protein n=1 Tax=Dermacentor silvarum TaxID=543639 RepID=A0ACB8D5Z5_DERSI|nr:beta-1,4-glucuronyltransferase 1 [Dermacentor silvarum]KAH7959808.1 hypothetical protein HPB49_013969 [Dermacentor silvarum]
MSSYNKTKRRVAYCSFITVYALFILSHKAYFQMPRRGVKSCALVVANPSQQETIKLCAMISPQPFKTAPSIDEPQHQIRQGPHQSKQAATRAPDAACLGRISNDAPDGSKVISTPRKNVAPKYSAQRDFILSDLSVPFDESVTLTTQATHEFLQHVPVLCSRWQGPISVAVYAPGTDYAVALDKIAYLRHCGDPCVSANVSWHVAFDKSLAPPRAVKVNTSSSAQFLRSWNGSCSSDVMGREYAQFRKAHHIPYPINVLRNLARRRARTRYILASDIELYPSANVIPRFLNLVAERRRRNATVARTPQVFVLPVFEVGAKQRPPLTKRVLVEMMRNKTAVFFHKWICDQCHRFPKREEWVNYVPADENQLDIFTTTKHDRSKSFWEPIYIGTNDDPLYTEAFNWEGKQDKMSQVYELCLRGYDFHILDNAFLVHAPGIKYVNASDGKSRTPFMGKNKVRYALIMKYLRSRYPALANDC